MFEFFCHKGFPIKLQNVAKGFGLKGKLDGLSGHLAPGMWAKGEHQKVIDYAIQDVRMTLDVYRHAMKARRIQWLSAKGKLLNQAFPGGFHPVSEVMNLPEPDTSWMDSPIRRSRFAGWLKDS